ncbi:hypothetical protein FZD47_02355 [Bacillus infantis]|uniref:Uncharacterized protein n=1 Tax=Bacillus infantis TaxID=324767 RepID=A0A5D4STQ3_9BACI|nr:hypothetical protein [Bacillus infantis]TYS66349.1 hypothetical protein FZD47_02355 [Bacillus infantis]
MNLSQSTNQQLYEIAKDEKARMKDRYAAAKELQERKKKNAGSQMQISGLSRQGGADLGTC